MRIKKHLHQLHKTKNDLVKKKNKIKQTVDKIKNVKSKIEKFREKGLSTDESIHGLRLLLDYLAKQRNEYIAKKEAEQQKQVEQILSTTPKQEEHPAPQQQIQTEKIPPKVEKIIDFHHIDYGAVPIVQQNGHGIFAACAQDAYTPPSSRKNFFPFIYKEGEDEWGLWVNGSLAILAFRGTVASVSDIFNDVEIAVGFQCALPRVQFGLTIAGKFIKQYSLSTTGHSLGGAVARCVGFNFKIPSVNFNPAAPPTAPVYKNVPLATNYHIVFDIISAWSTDMIRIDVGLRPLYEIMDTIKLVQDVADVFQKIVSVLAWFAIIVTAGAVTVAAGAIVEVTNAIDQAIDLASIASRIGLGLAKVFESHYMTRFFRDVSPSSKVITDQDENDLWEDLDMHIPSLKEFINAIPLINNAVKVIVELTNKVYNSGLLSNTLWPPLPGTINKSPQEITELFKQVHPYEHLLDSFIQPTLFGYKNSAVINPIVNSGNPYFPNV